VFNRGHEKRQLFSQPDDYVEFLRLLRDAPQATDVPLLGYCLMPNHWHLVVAPVEVRALSAYLQWVTGRHGLRWRRRHAPAVTGPVYQGRFRSVPIVNDRHLFTALRYVEANAARSGLVARASEWPWSSAALPYREEGPPLVERPWPMPANWRELLDIPQTPEQLDAVRRAVARSRSLKCLECSHPAESRL